MSFGFAGCAPTLPEVIGGDAAGSLVKAAPALIQEPDLAVRTTIHTFPVEASQFPSGIEVVGCFIKTSISGVYSVDFKHYDDVVDVAGTSIAVVATAGGEDEADSGAISVDVAAGRVLGVELPATDIDAVQVTFFYKEK